MALKKPGELFEGKAPEEKPSINVVENVKEEFNKVSQIRKQLDDVSSSLTEVVDKNFSFLSNEYSDLLEKFKVPLYKIASFEITDYSLISYIASKKKPIIIIDSYEIQIIGGAIITR